MDKVFKSPPASPFGNSIKTPSLISTTTLLSLASTVAILAAAYGLSLRFLPSARTTLTHRLLFIWHAFDSLTHLTLEASYLYNCFFVYTSFPILSGPTTNILSSLFGSSPAPHPLGPLTAPGVHFLNQPTRLYGAAYSTNPTAKLWQEYARADRRWAGADLTIISLELLTVFGAGPLAAYICYLLAQTHSSSASAKKTLGATQTALYFSMVVLATGELYGGFMTFAPEWLSGSPNLDTSNWMFLWLYLVFFNMLWVFIPLWALYVSFGAIKAAFEGTVEGKGGLRTLTPAEGVAARRKNA